MRTFRSALLCLAAALVLAGCASSIETATRYYRFVFDAGSTELPPQADAELARLAQAIREDESRIVVVAAFAGTARDDRQEMQRISIERVLRVRSYLLDAGLSNARMDLRACGYRDLGAPPDRVDIFVVKDRPNRPGPCGPRPADEGVPPAFDESVTIPI